MRAFLGALVVALFLSVCAAQSPQTGTLSVTPLTSGHSITGIIAPSTQDSNYHVQLYSIFVPEETSNVTFSFGNTNSGDCSYLNLFIRSDALPCSYHDYEDVLEGTKYLCTFAYNPSDGISSSDYSTVVYPGYYSDIFEFAVNKTFYIGIGRYGDYNLDTCTYTLSVQLSTPCGNGSVAVRDDYDDDQACEAYTTVMSENNITFSGAHRNIYKLYVPMNTGSVHVAVIANSSDVTIYGSSFYAPSSYSDAVYESYYSDSTDDTNYFYHLDAYTPRQGFLYFSIETDDADFVSGTISFHVQQCPLGWGGWNCTFPSVPLNFTALSKGINLTVDYDYSNNPDLYLDYGWSYFYFDIPTGYSGNDIAIFADSNDYVELFIRRDGFPEDADYGYEDGDEYDSVPARFGINQFEYNVPGRIYFGFECDTEPRCHVQISSAVQPVTTTGATAGVVTTGGATTGTATTSKSTTTNTATTSTTSKLITTTTTSGVPIATTTNAASSLLPSFLAVIIAAFLLL